MNIVSGFFNSPFSDNSTSLQVAEPRVLEPSAAGCLPPMPRMNGSLLGRPLRHSGESPCPVLLSTVPLSHSNFILALTHGSAGEWVSRWPFTCRHGCIFSRSACSSPLWSPCSLCVSCFLAFEALSVLTGFEIYALARNPVYASFKPD